MDDDPRKRSIKELGWQSWLTNVFWAYYKWYFFVGLALLTILLLTVIGYARQERVDLVLTYVYASAPDEAQAETARSLFAAKAAEEGGRGGVRVKVEAFPLVNEKGERLLYGELDDPDRIIYIADDGLLRHDPWDRAGHGAFCGGAGYPRRTLSAGGLCGPGLYPAADR